MNLSDRTLGELLQVSSGDLDLSWGQGETQLLTREAGGDVAGEIPETLDHYRVEGLLGQGGMGRVYLAMDTKLRRAVALKFLRMDAPNYRQRFLEEARAQARIEHPHVAKMYEVGEALGQPFLAMQYIQGSTLREATAGCGLEERVRLLAEACEAVHAAHREGLLHRDLKPANILVEAGEDGRRRAYVMDFGLALDLDRGRPEGTQAGVVLGSPAYMSPEQVRGLELDRRSDVHALGATMFELLTGRVPFEGPAVTDTLVLIAEAPAPAPRSLDPMIPLELEAICLRCLEKDPAHRYPSAQALGEDLRRYLAGEPVAAMGGGLLYRTGKWVGRNRRSAAVVGLSVLLVAGVGAWGVRVALGARTRAYWAHRFGEEAKELETFLAMAYLAPSHDLRPNVGYVQGRMTAIEAQLGNLPKAAQGPGHYALGRGYMALQKPVEALDQYQRAAASGYAEADLRFARGLARILIYAERRKEARGEAQRRDLDRAYVRPALEDLRKGQAGAGESRWLAEAIVDSAEGREAAALAKAQKAQADHPWNYEGLLSEAELRVSRAVLLLGQGERDAARAELRRAEDQLARAVAWGRSDPRAWLARAHGWRTEVRIRLAARESVEEAVVACREAIEGWAALHAPSADGFNLGAALALDLAQDALVHGRPIGSFVERARADCRRGLAIQEQARSWVYLGRAGEFEAQECAQRGWDPHSKLIAALDAMEHAKRLDPSDGNLHEGLASAYLTLAQDQSGHGREAAPSFDRAVEAAEAVLRLNPEVANAYRNLGALLMARGEYHLEDGSRGASDLERGREVLLKALERNPKEVDAWAYLGIIDYDLATRALSSKQDPVRWIARGQASCEQGLALQSEAPSLPVAMAYLAHAESRWRLRQNLSPDVELDRMASLLQRIRTLNPQSQDLPGLRLRLAFGRLEASERAKRPIAPQLQQLVRQCEAELKRSPADGELMAHWAVAQAEQAALARGRARELGFEKAEATFAKALRLKPRGLAEEAAKLAALKGA